MRDKTRQTITLTVEQFEAMKTHPFWLNAEGQLIIASVTGDVCAGCKERLAAGQGYFEAERAAFLCVSCELGLVFDDQ